MHVAVPALLLGSLLATGGLLACAGPGGGEGRMRDRLRPERHFEGDELALARAAMAGEVSRVQELVARRGADPDAVSGDGLPLLAWALLAGSLPGVEGLLEAGADPNLATPGFGSPMALAARSEDPVYLRTFLLHGGDPDTMTDAHEPLWYVAAVNERWPQVRVLIEHGADPDLPAHRNPANTLLAYYSAGRFEQTLWLLEHGADPGYRIREAADPAAVGRQPVIDRIYWWPVDPVRFPEQDLWQRRCQEWMSSHGYPRPETEPAALRQLRESRRP